MKKKLLIMACAFFMCANVFAQNITFNGYWELPDGIILLIKERICVFANPNGSYRGGTGGFTATARQFTLQNPSFVTIHSFDYTVIDSGSIRVTDTSNDDEWIGIWRKRTNIPGTTTNHRINGYWEGRDGDRTEILYFAGDDIVPVYSFSDEFSNRQTRPQYGWRYSFDRENQLVSIYVILFTIGRDFIFYGYDYGPFPIRFDGADLLVGQFGHWSMSDTYTRFVRK